MRSTVADEAEAVRQALRSATTRDELEAALTAADAWLEAHPENTPEREGLLATAHVASMTLAGTRN